MFKSIMYINFLMALVVLVMAPVVVIAAPVLTNSVVGGSGAITGEGNLRLHCTIGQALVGFATSPTTTLEIGFWHGRNAAVSPVPLPFTSSWMLEGNHPNPFNPQTTIKFSLPYASVVYLHIYDVRGRLVRTLADGDRPAGSQSVVWDGRGDNGAAMASGVYVVRLVSDQGTLAKKMMLVR